MKAFTFICILSLLIPVFGTVQAQKVQDDIYFRPSKAKALQQERTESKSRQEQKIQQAAPKYKNGAKEIIYIDRDKKNTIVVERDSVYVLAEANDSTEGYQEDGYYLHGFKGTQSDLEYAERIRRFHSPKYRIFIGDPRYNDIYFLNDNDWNIYIDDSYAYVTPTWTNPYWWNYNFSPHGFGWGYSSWYSPFNYGWHSPYYSGWYNPWGYGGFGYGYGYGGFGYPYGYGYGYGYGYPYYGYGGYYDGYYGGYYGGGYWGGSGNYKSSPRHDEARRREASNLNPSGSRIGGSSSSAVNSGYNAGSRNPYTTISGSGSRRQAVSPENATGRTSISSRPNATPSSVNRGNGIGVVRSGESFSRQNQSTTRQNPVINTTPRTGSTTVNSSGTTVTRPEGSQSTRGTATYSTGAAERRSSGSNVSTPSRNNYSTPSYNGGSSSSGSRSSSPSYSGSSSSSSGGGSRSSGSGSSSSGGRR